MRPDPDIIARAADRLRGGDVVAFPTETVYGLGADALNAAAVARVFALKGRPATNPLIVHVADEGMARALAAAWPVEAHLLAEAFWPGPLTIVVPKSPRVPDIVTAGGPTVALRVPDHPVALALIRAFGGPMVGPSANPSGRVSPTAAAHVREAFPDVEVLDGGPCRAGIESTVVSLADGPRILRPGVVTAEMIERALGRPVAVGNEQGGAQPAQSPGLLPVHYAPRARARLFRADELPAILGAHSLVVVVAFGDVRIPAPHRLIRLPAEAPAYAARLYAALREADAAGPALIAIESPPDTGGVWTAVHDRLRRAVAAGPENSMR